MDTKYRICLNIGRNYFPKPMPLISGCGLQVAPKKKKTGLSKSGKDI
jgi:hypothetical protein